MSIRSRLQSMLGAEKPQVRAELGATGTSVFAGLLYEEEYNSDLQGEKAIKTYDKMRRSDGQVKAGLLACKLPLMVARWDVAPASDEQLDVEIAQMVKDDLFENMTITWDDFLRQALIMLDFGHMPFEKVWELRDGRYAWRKMAPRLPQSIAEWHVTDEGELDHVVQQAIIGSKFEQVSIPADKLLVFTHEREGSNFRGISLLRAAYKHWYYKNNLYAIDGIAAERHGVGLASFTYPDQATEAQKAAVREIGERLHTHERSYEAHPESIKFDLKGVQGQLHDIMRSIDHHDLQIVRSILAQFMNLGAKSTGSYALSQDQSQFFLMALQAVGRNVCNTVNRYGIKEMVDYNWEVSRYPKLTVSGLDSPDVLAYAGAIAQLVSAGAIVPDDPMENELRRIVKMPLKTADSAPRPAPKPAGAPATERTWPADAEEAAADRAKAMQSGDKAVDRLLRAAEFWRTPTALEKSVAFADIEQTLDTFEDQFVKAVTPIQRKQTKALVNVVAGYLEDGKLDKLTEIDVPYKAQVADAIEKLLGNLVEYGAKQVKDEAEKQGASLKAQDVPPPPGPKAFLRVKALAIANILANRMRAATTWEALRQSREGSLNRGQLTAATDDLSDKELRKVSKASASEAVNLGRQEQAKGMRVKDITSSALLDSNTCDFCRRMDGEHWVPGDTLTKPDNLPVPMEPPYEECEGKDRCRCLWVYTFSQED